MHQSCMRLCVTTGPLTDSDKIHYVNLKRFVLHDAVIIPLPCLTVKGSGNAPGESLPPYFPYDSPNKFYTELSTGGG